jgi:hypothetical protein
MSGINIIGTSPQPITTVPAQQGPPPKIVPRAADAQDPTWPSSDQSATPGSTGILGLPGQIGETNFPGGPTPANLTFSFGNVIGTLPITILGGNGGDGGQGGQGQDGGEGQDGGRGEPDDNPNDAPGGQGGTGGIGGQGGAGGKGGNADSFNVSFANADVFANSTLNITFNAGFGGHGGPGGTGGNGGLGGLQGERNAGPRAETGTSGTPGPWGVDGIVGEEGTAIISIG